MTTTIIPLNLIYDYPVNWSRFKTLRDFVQNFFDAVGWQNWSTRFSFEIANNTLTLRATDIGFSYDWLLHIGASTKREGNHAGYFGEGFKIASLCATRDHGWNVALSSQNWSLKVCSSPILVDDRTQSSLAYEIDTQGKSSHDTVMSLYPFYDRPLMQFCRRQVDASSIRIGLVIFQPVCSRTNHAAVNDALIQIDHR